MKEKAGQSTIKETFALNRQFAGAFSALFFFEQKATYHRGFKMQGKRNKRYERHHAGSNEAGGGEASEGRQKTTGGTTIRLLVPAIQLSSYTAFCFQSQP